MLKTEGVAYIKLSALFCSMNNFVSDIVSNQILAAKPGSGLNIRLLYDFGFAYMQKTGSVIS